MYVGWGGAYGCAAGVDNVGGCSGIGGDSVIASIGGVCVSYVAAGCVEYDAGVRVYDSVGAYGVVGVCVLMLAVMLVLFMLTVLVCGDYIVVCGVDAAWLGDWCMYRALCCE